jgi:DNA-binding XRE family transcriptional regulator
VVVVTVQRIADSCGYAVPLYEDAGERGLLGRWTDGKDDATLAAYRVRHNRAVSTTSPAEVRAAGGSSTAGSLPLEGIEAGRDRDWRADVERRGAARRPVAAQPPDSAAVVPTASFGELLRAYRERALLSQDKLAERAGLSPRTIRELEAGRVKRPQGTSVRLLAQALGLRGSLRQAFVAAARTHPAARSGDAALQGGGGGPSPTGGGGVLALPPLSEGGGVDRPSILVLSLGDGLAAPSSALWSPDAMSGRAVGPRPHERAAGLGGFRVIVVAVATELRVRCCGRCRACGRWETG